MTINVTNCKDCIFKLEIMANRNFCTYIHSKEKGKAQIKKLDKILPNCPLKKQEITVKLNI